MGPLFEDIKAKKRMPKLEPIIGEGEGVSAQLRADPKISGRIEKLKDLLKSKKEKIEDRTIRLGDKKSASSLSLLFPGLGQIYMGQIALGLTFALSNALLFLIYLFLSGILTMSAFSQNLVSSYDFHVLLMAPLAIAVLSAISIHMAFGLSPEFRLTELITANRKKNLYRLAFLFPGYGQILNGQPRKAAVFTFLGILGAFSAASMFFTYSINWYEYTENLGVVYVEKAMIVMALTFAISVFAYVLSVFDAFVVKINPYIKRPLSTRLKRYFGSQSGEKDKTKYRKTSPKFLAVSLLLIFFMGMNLSQRPQREFYASKLDGLKDMFYQKGMVMIPGMLDRVKMPKAIEDIYDYFGS